MVLIETPKVNKGLSAIDFNLQDIDGNNHSIQNIKLENGFVIAFVCNHCPYVKSIAHKFYDTVSQLKELEIGFCAIMPNDFESYSDDSPEKMKEFAKKYNFNFPYLIGGSVDETQSLAKKYGAVCTPDFFGFDKNNILQYRGRLDASRANTDPDVADMLAPDLINAMRELKESNTITTEQYNSIGCSIKWKE